MDDQLSYETRLGIGIHHNVPENVYHSDPAEEPSASSSILRTLYKASPEHAWTDHPRLNPAWQSEPSTDAQSIGTILHALTLGTPPPHRVLHFDDYRGGAAKKARDETLADGLIPILSHKYDEIARVSDHLMRRIKRQYPDLFNAMTDTETEREVTMIWREAGALCRCRFDILPPARYGFTADLKFTGRGAEPEEWSNKIRKDYLFQGGFYPRAVKALRGDRPEFRFIVCETDPPYGVSVHALGPVLDAVAERRINVALAQWAHCLKANEWPGYPPMVHYADAPPWLDTVDNERAMRSDFVANSTSGVIAQLHRIAAQIGSPMR